MYLLMFIKPMTKLPSLADIDLRRTYRAIDSVATGRIPSLFCAVSTEMIKADTIVARRI